MAEMRRSAWVRNGKLFTVARLTVVNLAQYRSVVGDGPPLVLHSWFAHCQEQGKWRTWHWMNQTPDGGRCAGPAESDAELSRKHGLVPVIAWTWMEYPDEALAAAPGPGCGQDWPDYYPGDDYVDWLAIDVYSSRNPREVLQQFLDLYGKTGKPILIPEGGTGPVQTQWNKQYAGDAAWVKEMFDVIETTPQIKALCWFQYGKEWNVERDPGQLAEYQRRLRAARYSVPFSGRQDSTRTGGAETPR